MSCRMLAGSVLAAALLGTGAAHAQTPQQMTDVGPPPAEERDSSGAVVLEKSMVRAQREKAFSESAARTGVDSVGRGVLRATMRAKAEADLARARDADATELREQGAGGLTAK